jgi:quercetin dioxygenase-like cupin family protein
MPEMLTRRELLLTAAAALLPAKVLAIAGQKNISWSAFQDQMTALAAAAANRDLEQKAVAERGMRYLKQLDIQSAEFKEAVDVSFETGNRYWLWQRMIKGQDINGGILNIDSDQLVPLHDHPGATGIIRIISGEVEAWQFDVLRQDSGEKGKGTDGRNTTELSRVSHRILKAGDMVVLTPDKGNIHALRAVSKQCRMLDFFIPPYQRSQRSWYEPLAENWFNEERVACRKIPLQKNSATCLYGCIK